MAEWYLWSSRSSRGKTIATILAVLATAVAAVCTLVLLGGFTVAPTGLVEVKCIVTYVNLESRYSIIACNVPGLDFPVPYIIHDVLDVNYIYRCRAVIVERQGVRVLTEIRDCVKAEKIPFAPQYLTRR